MRFGPLGEICYSFLVTFKNKMEATPWFWAIISGFVAGDHGVMPSDRESGAQGPKIVKSVVLGSPTKDP